MKISPHYRHRPAHLRLELTMRDALDGMEEMASLCSQAFMPDCMEILAIEPPGGESCSEDDAGIPTATVLQFPNIAESA